MFGDEVFETLGDTGTGLARGESGGINIQKAPALKAVSKVS